MAVVIQNYPKFKYTIASTGEPGAGYQLFTYEEGTSTKQTTWTSLAKTAENTNPVILDANGEADVWIDGNYKFVLALPTDTDPPSSPVWTYDAIRSSDVSAITTTEGDKPINGSFEVDEDSDSNPDNWTLSSLSGGTIALDTTTSTHGTTSLKFTSTGSGAGTALTDDYYEVEAGKVTGLRFSIISDDADTLNKVQVHWYNNSKSFLSTSDAYNDGATNPTTWTRKYTNITAPATAKYARILLTGVDAASTTHSNTNFDNIEFDNKFIGEITANLAELNTLDGLTASTIELNYTDGVTSAIQTQLDAKPDSPVGTSDIASNEQMTTTNVLAATAGATAGAVGTYAFGRRTSGDIAFGATAAGSGIVPCSASDGLTGGFTTGNSVAGAALSGTWQAMGYSDAFITNVANGVTLWMRTV